MGSDIEEAFWRAGLARREMNFPVQVALGTDGLSLRLHRIDDMYPLEVATFREAILAERDACAETVRATGALFLPSAQVLREAAAKAIEERPIP